MGFLGWLFGNSSKGLAEDIPMRATQSKLDKSVEILKQNEDRRKKLQKTQLEAMQESLRNAAKKHQKLMKEMAERRRKDRGSLAGRVSAIDGSIHLTSGLRNAHDAMKRAEQARKRTERTGNMGKHKR